ncbi:unnamed protein product [Fusarium equiseti]|uniref:Apple domain-containing protein n=1 Tax=Fusarium equiseti TaxID=61235 RepID=A0A8J2J0A6_FUSEQ|nr:unnamed protein product [Fusarium equiseti]
MTSLSEITFIPETTNTTGVAASSTEVVNDVGTTATTDNTDTTTTTEGDTSSTKAVSDIDTTTADTMDTTTTNEDTTTLPENLTTIEAQTTTAEITTTAEPTTATAAAPEPQFDCGDAGLTNPYTYSGVTFNLLCGRDWSYVFLDGFETESFSECLRRCALDSLCNGFAWDPPFKYCGLGTQVDDLRSNPLYDAGEVVSRSG